MPQLALSALYRDVVQDSSTEEWQKALASPSRIHCWYDTTAMLALPERRTLVFDEILLPLSGDRYPAYLYVRRGEHVLRLAKYDPWVLHKLVSESGLSLYPQLANVERGLF